MGSATEYFAQLQRREDAANGNVEGRIVDELNGDIQRANWRIDELLRRIQRNAPEILEVSND